MSDETDLRDRCERMRTALFKINAIRNDIIARQSINWSRHIYPLVAALGEAGYEYDGAAAEMSPKERNPDTKDGQHNAMRAERARVVKLAREAVNHLYGMNTVAEDDRSSYEAAKSLLHRLADELDQQ